MKKVMLFIMLLFAFQAFADNLTVQVSGEAFIINNDLASAKLQAESRARWSAIEKVSLVKVNVSTVIHNAQVLDESVKSEVAGLIKSFVINDEGVDNNTYWLEATVTVEPDSTRFLQGFAKNTSIAVYLPMQHADKSLEEAHPASEAIINELINKGFEVMDLAAVCPPSVSDSLLEAAARGDMNTVRQIASDYMAGTVLVGRLNILDKGKDIGYGKINFSIVDGELSYRVMGDRDGARAILLSETFMGRGQGATAETAAYAASRSIAKKNAPVVAGNVAATVLGAANKSIRVVLLGNTDLRKFQEFRDSVKNTSWVLNVRESGVNSVILDYPEKTFYLAAIITSNGYKVRDFNDNEIFVYPK